MPDAHTTASWLRRTQLAMTFFWPVFAIPCLIWWKNSILLVIGLSLYANWKADLAGYMAGRTEQRQIDEGGG